MESNLEVQGVMEVVVVGKAMAWPLLRPDLPPRDH